MKKHWLLHVVLMLTLASCAPVELTATEPLQTDTPIPPTEQPTLPPVEPTATLPPPPSATPVLDLPGASLPVVQAAQSYLAQRLRLEPADIQVLQVTTVEWRNACLGIYNAGMMCADVITPGFVIDLQVVVDGKSEYFVIHSAASGGALSLLPGAVYMARQALIAQTGIRLENILQVSVETVEWRNSCLGVTKPGVNCLDVIVPGFRIVFQVDGERYEYHTNQDGSRVVLASAPVAPTAVLLTWTSLTEPCMTVEISPQEARYGPCGSQLTLAEYFLPQRQADLESFARLYQSFDTQTAAGGVSFRGLGQVTATPAEMRMLAEWGSLIYGEAVNQRNEMPLKMAISYHREGGIAGFCDTLGVYRTGFAILSSCREEAQNLPYPRLDSSQLEMLYGWYDSLASFEFTQADPAVADALFINLTFGGQGTEVAGEQVQQAILVEDLLLQAETPPDPAAQAAAQQALTDYLAALAAADYAAAATLYGGSYDLLIDNNPSRDPSDHASLFEGACTINGYVCNLSIHNVVSVAGLGFGSYRFMVELQNPQGALFELVQCCTSASDGTPPHTQFAFLVELVDGRYRVMTLPIYAG